MPKKPHKRASPKQRDPSWRMRRALGHKVETNPKAYTRKRKHPKEDESYGRWCLAYGSSGNQINLRYFNTVVELYSSYHLGQAIEAS